MPRKSVAVNPDDDRAAQTVGEFCAENKISISTWQRLRQRGDTPRLTWITADKAIIRRHHGREWLDARASTSSRNHRDNTA